MTEIFDKQEIYTTLVQPKLKELFDLCERYKVPFFSATLTYANPETGECRIGSSRIAAEVSDQFLDVFVCMNELLADAELTEAVFQMIMLRELSKRLSGHTFAPGSGIPN